MLPQLSLVVSDPIDFGGFYDAMWLNDAKVDVVVRPIFNERLSRFVCCEVSEHVSTAYRLRPTIYHNVGAARGQPRPPMMQTLALLDADREAIRVRMEF